MPTEGAQNAMDITENIRAAEKLLPKAEAKLDNSVLPKPIDED